MRSLVRSAAAASLALGLLGGSQAAQGATDVLERPALQTALLTKSALLGVARAGNRVVAVGEHGLAVYSDDDGRTWTQAVVPVSVSLTNLFFLDQRTGWAVGHCGVVLHSEDGGKTWTRQLDGRQAARILFDGASQALERAPGDPGARRRLQEARQLVEDGPDKPFFDLWFRNDREGFVVGAYGLILGTTDGGRSWQSWQERLDNPKGNHLYSIDAADDDLYIAGEQGALYHSTDGGKSFSGVKTPYEGTYFGVRRIADGVLVFGLRGSAFRSANGLTDWQKVDYGSDEALNSATVLSDGTLVLLNQAGSLLRLAAPGQPPSSLPAGQAFPLTGAVQASDGALVVTGLGGVSRVPATDLGLGASR